MSDKSEDRILFRLKTHGPQTAQALANHCEMTSVGARQHLTNLMGKGLVAFSEHKEKVGRPARYWNLSKKGHAEFPDNHAHLTLDLLKSVRQVFGEGGLDKLITAREGDSLTLYAQRLQDKISLKDKVKELAMIRDQEGYMAGWTENEDGSFILFENHCPICAAAQTCQNICRSELALFQAALGDGIRVTRQEYLLEGARRCSYLLSSGR